MQATLQEITAISIHALREEGDKVRDGKEVARFISIHALREEGDRPPSTHSTTASYFYPRPPRGGRQRVPRHRGRPWPISIHALREEGDTTSCPVISAKSNFYPRPPRGGRLCQGIQQCNARVNFYPRPPRGGRPAPEHLRRNRRGISIHALREEGDLRATEVTHNTNEFLSTPSARRATSRPLEHGSNVIFLSTPSARRATGRRAAV